MLPACIDRPLCRTTRSSAHLVGKLAVDLTMGVFMTNQFLAIDATGLPWEEHYSDAIGKAIFRKELFSDPDTGMLVRLVRYPAGVINPAHTHPCGHGMYVLEGTLVTHKGTFGAGSFVWFPEGEVMEHGASADADVVVVFITNKPFRIDYVAKK